MSRLRWRKLGRDVLLSRARVAAMVLAMAVSIAAIAAFLQARAILGREISANYLAGRPASATLHLATAVTAQDVAVARSQPGVTDAVARGSLPARIRVGSGDWRSLLMTVSAPDDPRRLSSVAVEQGSWPPAPDGILLERKALPYLGARVGDRVEVRVPGRPPVTLTVTGSVHDPGVAPASQEQMVYAQITTATLARLGLADELSELKIAVGAAGRPSGDPDAVTATARRVAAAVSTAGPGRVTRIDVPPPLRHPHYGQMVTVGFVLLTCGLVALLLSSILVATMLGGMLTAQIRQIAAMKAVGARTGQLFGMYLGFAVLLAAIATALAALPGLAAGRFLARVAGGLLNLDLTDTSAPWWVLATVLLAGIGVPVLVAVPPLLRGSRRTVREGIDDHGVDPAGSVGRIASRLGSWLARLPGTSRTDALAVRNLGRRPARLALTVGLLAVAGMAFVTGLNAVGGWNALAREGVVHRHYDLEVRLETPVAAQRVLSVARGIPGVCGGEAWNRVPIAAATPGQVDVTHVYPDEAHGSFTLLAPPADTPLISLPVLSGRWLTPQDSGTVVLNSLAASRQLNGAEVGAQVLLTVDGRQVPFTVVGIVSDFGTQAAAYVTDRQYAALATGQGMSRTAATASVLRVVTDPGGAAARRAILDRLTDALEAQGIPVESALTTDDLRSALDGHVFVLIEALMAIALLIGFVGLLGLGSALGTSVTERTREFGVMSAIGARPTTVRGLVVTEGVLTGIAGLLIAAMASVPLTVAFGSFLGEMAFKQPLPTTIGPAPLLLWTALTLCGAAVASAAAARKASRLTVREALAVL
ncbi:MAG TPA: ABC transporter permease [Kineosporiaceae bacterium]|nr:ABC transporter permease [Kineosporiaceae bacterium]